MRETLDMRVSYEKLRKELERSEQRDQALTRELLATRATMHEAQRDLHTFKTVFEKTNAERKCLASQLAEAKDYNSKLELQISRMDQSCQLVLELDSSQGENRRLQKEMEKQDAVLKAGREKDLAQLREIEALNRSLDACVFYQGNQREGAVSGDKLREIYYELGKRQTDIHALSLSLSQVNAELLEMKQTHTELQRLHATTEVEIKHVKEYNDQLLQTNITVNKQMASIEKERNGLRECNGKLQEDVTNLMDKLKASMLGAADTEEKNEARINELNVTVEELQSEKRQLTERLEALTLSLRHRESLLALAEQRLEAESQRLREDRQSLAESQRQGEAHSSQIEMLRSNMTNALRANEILARESREVADSHRMSMSALNERCIRAEAQNQALAEQTREREEDLRTMVTEREEMVAAFKKSIAAAKGLSARLVREQAINVSLKEQLEHSQQSMHQVIKAKEQVSYAVLDALYKERSQHSHNKSGGDSSSLSRDETPHRSNPMHSSQVGVSRESTPIERPPLRHPLTVSSLPLPRYDDTVEDSSEFNHSAGISNQQQHQGNASHRDQNAVVDVSEEWDGTTVEGQSHVQEDSLYDSLDRSTAEDGIIFGKANVSNDLKRLRREVEVLEQKSHSNKSTTSESQHATSVEEDDLPSESSRRSNDDDSLSHSSSHSVKKHHSLFDLMDLDPRVAFEYDSKPSSPARSHLSSIDVALEKE
jgi:hypothetical protein